MIEQTDTLVISQRAYSALIAMYPAWHPARVNDRLRREMPHWVVPLLPPSPASWS